MRTFIFHADAGHGWLQVRRQELTALGIAEKITPYSYQHLDNVYLEEDLDAGTFLQALKADGRKFTISERYDGDRSTIRNFDSFAA